MAKTHCWCGKPVAWNGAAICREHNEELVGGLTEIAKIVVNKVQKKS